MPTGFSTPRCTINAGSTIPDPAHNITAALALHPNAIIMLGGQGNFILGGAPERAVYARQIRLDRLNLISGQL